MLLVAILLAGALEAWEMEESKSGGDALRLRPGSVFDIRINDRYRLCFIWDDGGANQVEIVDYH